MNNCAHLWSPQCTQSVARLICEVENVVIPASARQWPNAFVICEGSNNCICMHPPNKMDLLFPIPIAASLMLQGKCQLD